jgi:uncharacterized protein YicC (UPF0701 family)
MEPFKALTFLAAVGIVSLVGAGATGFYAGYSAGRGNLDEIKAQIAGLPTGGDAGAAARALALKPVQEDLRALSKQVETLAAVKPVDPSQATKPVLDEIKALGRQLEGWRTRPAADSDQATSNKPVLEEIKALARQVENLRARQGAEPEQGLKPVLDEIKALTRQVEALKTVRPTVEPTASDKLMLAEIKALTSQVEALKASRPTAEPTAGDKAVLAEIKALASHVDALKASRSTAEPTAGGDKAVLAEIKALASHLDALKAARPTAEPSAGGGDKAVLEEIKALSRQVEAFRSVQPNRGAEGLSAPVVPDYTEALHSIREQVTALNAKLEKQEPKAPKALLDEIRSLSASVQAQEPVARRAISEELRSAVAALQNSETRLPRALAEEIHTIAANVRPDTRPQPSSSDQIKVLAASIESLKAKIGEDGGRGRGDSGGSVAGEVAQLHKLVAAASDQFSRCQTQLASLSSAGAGLARQQAPATTAVAMSQAGRQPSTVVFYDNVMLKKDQEKQYDEIGVKLALQSVGPRQVKVAVNRQGVGLAFGERKVFRSQDVECELNLMETNLNEAQARVSISCKR